MYVRYILDDFAVSFSSYFNPESQVIVINPYILS